MNDMEWGGIGDPEGPFVPGRPSDGSASDGSSGQEGRDGHAPVLPEEAVAVAEGLFWAYIRDLRLHQADLEARGKGEIDPARLKKAVETARTVREAVHLLMVERNKVDKLRKDIAGGVGGGSLDLDAARDEIGRRLACLRRAAAG